LPVQDPEDEDEQSRVRSQAQALLDCVADLIVHSGLQGAINLLTEGAQLQRIPSGMGSLGSPRSGSDGLSRMGSETWRIVGSLPPGFGEGAAAPLLSQHASQCCLCTGCVGHTWSSWSCGTTSHGWSCLLCFE
jgi:hypothetical protein